MDPISMFLVMATNDCVKQYGEVAEYDQWWRSQLKRGYIAAKSCSYWWLSQTIKTGGSNMRLMMQIKTEEARVSLERRKKMMKLTWWWESRRGIALVECSHSFRNTLSASCTIFRKNCLMNKCQVQGIIWLVYFWLISSEECLLIDWQAEVGRGNKVHGLFSLSCISFASYLQLMGVEY